MANREITLPVFGIVVTLIPGPGGILIHSGGSISSDLEEECECGQMDRGYCSDCGYNDAMLGIEALILGHACAGIAITTLAYIEGIESAVQGAANNR